MSERADPRAARTDHALETAIVELASRQPVSQITVAALAERAGVTRATVYNRYGSPLEVLIRVLYADLDRGHEKERELLAEGGHSAAEMLRLTTTEVADHVQRFRAVYRQSLQDPADRGVHDALVRHFTQYALDFMARASHPSVPKENRRVVAAFVANGFAGAILEWLGDKRVTKKDLIAAAIGCAPSWWT